MNNEELAKNLRTEIQTYLKNTVADLQQEIAEMQERINAEIERHRGEIERNFQNLLAKGSAAGVDDNFARVVSEHLQIAYEDGSKQAKEAAEATLAAETERLSAEIGKSSEEAKQRAAEIEERLGEAQKQIAEARQRAQQAEQRLAEMERQAAAAEERFVEHQRLFSESQQAITAQAEKQAASLVAMHDAINEISTQTTQAEILKSLVKHASAFAPRGAFFIVKSDHLVGWRMFGNEISSGDETVREVFLPVNSNTLLSESIRQNAMQQSSGVGSAEDAQYLQKLNFGNPKRTVAIPLVVRGRGVAVLYADSGENGNQIQVEALEALVRVASLTVELLAAAKSPGAAKAHTGDLNKQAAAKSPVTAEAPTKEYSFASPQQAPAFSPAVQPSNFEQTQTAQTSQFETSYKQPNREEKTIKPQVVEQDFNASFVKPAESFSFDAPAPTPSYNEQKSNASFENFAAPQTAPRPTETTFSFDTPSYTPPPVTTVETQTETQSAPKTAPPRRFGERNLELPIDVPEDERRLHNDARRFARLLVSEIKLYNEQKVKEGRQAGDLYTRLREAVDRSREMYDKRVAPPVAARFDYFHYELVNTLAEGDESKLGSEYPGASV